jgi:hypothetical protein
MKPAVITPYHQEALPILERCHQSVGRQTVGVRHVLVADGSPRNEVDGWDCTHLRLPQCHGDCGNTPRSIGALHAASLGHHPIFFLDADNWLSPEHVETALAVQASDPSIDIVVMGRTIVLDDGTIVPPPPEDSLQHFADTSTLCCFRGAWRTLPLWALMPKELAPICDRILYESFKVLQLKVQWHPARTLWFESHYAAHYALAGRTSSTPLHDPDWAALRAAMPELLERYWEATGIRLAADA